MALRAAAVRIGSVLAFAVAPAAAIVAMFVVAWGSDTLAIDFHNEIYPEAKELLAGENPFPGPEADLTRGSNHIWPPLVGYLATPLTLLSPRGADVAIVAIGLIAFVAALWVVGVRDWRVVGASLLWAPVIGEMRTAHVTLILCLLIAVAWRYRDRAVVPGLVVGLAIGLKFFLWPLVLWLGCMRKWREAAISAAFAAATLLLLLPFITVAEYVRILRRLGAAFDQDAFGPYGLLVQADAPDRVARVAALSIGIAVLALAWRRRSFVLFLAAALLLSPIVWLDYYAVLAVPLAVVRPRLSIAWLLPILTWGVPSSGAGAGNVATSLRVLVIFGIITVLVERGERAAGRADEARIGAERLAALP